MLRQIFSLNIKKEVGKKASSKKKAKVENVRLDASDFTHKNLLGFLKLDLFKAISKVLFIWLIGVIGFFVLANVYGPIDKRDILNAFYMATISLTTVGYSDTLNFLDFPEPGRTISSLFLIIYLIAGYAIVVWASATVITYIIEGSLSDYIMRRKMHKKLEKLKDHIILAGIGSRGETIAKEMQDIRQDFVVVDRNQDTIFAALAHLSKEELHYVEGDATDDETLIAAGILKAKGLIANLGTDQDNLFITVSAKQLNPKIKVVTICDNIKSEGKLRKVGADSVVQINFIGGMRIVSEMLKPVVTGFLDKILRDQRGVYRVAEVTIPKDSPLNGKKMSESDIYKKTGLHIVAYTKNQTDLYTFNPAGDLILNEGGIIIVIGSIEQVEQLEHFVLTGK